MPGLAQPLRTGGVGPIRGLELPAAPIRQPRQAGSTSPDDVIPGCRPVDRQLGVPQGSGEVIPHQRQCGPIHLDRSGEAAELRIVADDRPLSTLWKGVTVIGSDRRQGLLDVPQTFLDAVELVAGHQRSDEADREDRPPPNDSVGQDIEPAADDGLLPVPLQVRDGQLDQIGGPLDVPGSQGVPDRRRRLTVLVVPAAGPAMQIGDFLGPLIEQAGLQHVREQVVVAVPVAPVVQRDQEQVRAVQLLEGDLAVMSAGHGVAQRAAQPVQQTGAQKKGADLFGLPRQHLLNQVVDDVSVVACEAGDKAADVLSALHGQRRQLQCSDPALCPSFQCGDVVGGEIQPAHVVEVGRRLLGCEPQVDGADLDQLPACPKTGQRQYGVSSATDRYVYLGREVRQHERHSGPDVGPVDEVVVVEHQVNFVRSVGKFVEHRDQYGLDRRLGRLQQREHVGPEAGHRHLQGGDHVGPERGGLAITLIQGQPGNGPILLGRGGKPRGEQGRLAEAGGSGDQRQRGLRPAAQLPRQPRTCDHVPPKCGDVELGLDQ